MVIQPRAGVEDVAPFDTASSFLDALSPRSSCWTPDPKAWIFRGQADAEWSLKAKAVRQPSAFKDHGIDTVISRGPDEWSHRVDAETKMLARFARGLSEGGHTIPLETPPIRGGIRTTSSAVQQPNLWPLLALAQHHGLPTNLLDWSRRALVAAYFAAYFGALELAEPARRRAGTFLAVWALKRTPEVPGWQIQFCEAPGGTNPNLAAQAGLFTMWPFDDGDPSLEEKCAALAAKPCGAPALRRLALPVEEAPKLLRLLADEGITGASMYPGADGVVKAMREEALWDKR